MKLTKAQIILLDKIQKLQPVSAVRLGVVKSPSDKVLKSLFDAGMIEAASKGMFGSNWQLTESGTRLAEEIVPGLPT